uniref:Uncharacterized protein n=1 Tax=uncultured Chloroflexi bacterium HF0200_09I09 TaxID=710736 RepID=E0XU80_9CHLR|nr:hypothetical protein [uncultured Chloroflexi bacterium HF0200_09I09]
MNYTEKAVSAVCPCTQSHNCHPNGCQNRGWYRIDGNPIPASDCYPGVNVRRASSEDVQVE